MAKIIKFPVNTPEKKGPTKARRRKKIDLEDHGQLNLFDQSRLIQFDQSGDFFNQALHQDGVNDELALDLYQKAVDKNKSKADAFCNMGIIRARQQEHSKSIDMFTKCLKEDARHFEAHYNLANVYSEKGNNDLAKMHYEVAIEINPSFADSYYNLSLVYIAEKSYKQALDLIDLYIEKVPEESEIRDLRNTLQALI